MYGSWDMVCDRCNYFSFWATFCCFNPVTARKIKILKKWKKKQTKTGDIIILHMCNKNYDQMMYSSWDVVNDRCNCYFSFWAVSCPFTPLTAWKIKILKKWKKGPGDIINLHMCSKNYDQMMYRSWDMGRDRCNCYFSRWAIFCTFTTLTVRKIKLLKKWKKTNGDIINLHMCIKHYDHMTDRSWDIVHDRCNYFSFWAFFCPFTLTATRKIKILEKWKKHPKISSFYIGVPKIMRYGVQQTDRRREKVT